MPRRRQTAQEAQKDSTDSTGNTTTNNQQTTKENKNMATTGMNTLDAAEITELLAKSKSRGEYDAALNEFIESGVGGVEVSLTEGRFAGSTAQKVSVGFNNARTRINKETNKAVHEKGNLVKVIKVGNAQADPPTEEHVYLINTGVGEDDGDES